MKNLFKILIILLLIGANSANCATLSNAKLNEIIYEKVYKEVSESLKNYSSDFKISITGILKEDFKTNDDFIPKVELISQNSSSKNFQAHLFKRVLIKDSKNNTIKAFPINIQTRVYKNVLTAKETIPYGKEIKQTDVTIERKEVSNCIDKVIGEYHKGYTSTRNFQKGSIITSNYLKEKSVIVKNSIVEITFISKSLKITLQGKALKDGAIGDMIPVRSDKYNKVYSGRINSENEVVVRI